MNRQQFSEIVKDPKTMGEGSITELQDLLREYPYCQTAQILLTLNLLRQNNPAYQAQLKKAVAYAGDRKKLKEFLEVKKEQSTAVLNEISAEVIIEQDQHTEGDIKMNLVSDHEEAAVTIPEISPDIQEEPVSIPEKEALSEPEGTHMQATITEPRQENYIEDSFISSEELALASPQGSAREDNLTSLTAPMGSPQPSPADDELKSFTASLASGGRTSTGSLEKMTQEELLSIVRKRLAEINNENKGAEVKQEKSSPSREIMKDTTVLKTVADSGRSKDELIEKFIREEPQISRPRKEFFNATASSQKSNLDEEDIVSETLALLYAKQGNMQKAIHIYEKLSLRFSEKSRYFAAQIENLKGNSSQSL